MIFLKLTFIFYIFFTFSEIEALSQNNNVGGVIDIITKFIKSIENYLDKIIAAAENFINGVTNDTWDDFQKKTVEVTTRVVTAILDHIVDNLEKMASQSTGGGQHIVDCVKSGEPDLISVRVQFYDDVSKCLGKDLVTTIQSFGPLIKDLAGVQNEAKEVADKINECSDDISGLECLAEIAVQLLKILNEIPNKVADDVTMIRSNIESLGKTVVRCVQEAAPVYLKNAGDALDKISKCAL